MRPTTSSLLRTALLSVTAIVPASALSGQEVRKGVDLSGSVEAVSNPSFDATQTEWSGAGTIAANPWLSTRTQTGRIDLQGQVRLRGFTNGYDLEDTYGAFLRTTHQPDARNRFNGSMRLTSTSARNTFARSLRGTGGGFFEPGLAPLNPAVGLPGAELPVDGGAGGPPVSLPFRPVDDVTLLGLSGRSTSLAMNAGVDHSLDARSNLSALLGYDRLWLSGSTGTGYRSTSAQVGYQQGVTERTSVGASVSTAITQYDGPFPKSTTLGLYGTANHQFDQRWSLSGSLGVNTSQSRTGGTRTGLAGNINACRSGPRDRLCLGASRTQQPSALGGVRMSNSVQLSYSNRINERDRVDLYGNYSLSGSGGPDDIAPQDISAVGVGGTFTRQLTQRTEAYAFANTSRTYGGFLNSEPSIAVGAGLRFKLGDNR